MTLRNATMNDAEILLKWRNDAATRSASHNVEEVKFDDHLIWLEATLSNSMRQLLIAEDKGRPVGCVRIDREPSGAELSWTVDPESRGNGIAKRMLQLVINSFPHGSLLRAEIKVENTASLKVALAAGMILSHETGNIFHLVKK